MKSVGCYLSENVTKIWAQKISVATATKVSHRPTTTMTNFIIVNGLNWISTSAGDGNIKNETFSDLICPLKNKRDVHIFNVSFIVVWFAGGIFGKSNESKPRRNYCCQRTIMGRFLYAIPKADTTIILYRVGIDNLKLIIIIFF